jgi:glycosyltransferase involved in cell wall biosynthesis
MKLLNFSRIVKALARRLQRVRFLWASEPDNHPDVIAEQAFGHGRAQASRPLTLAFCYHVPEAKIDAYLADARVGGVVTKDGQHQSGLPERLLDDPRVGRYWGTGWALPAKSREVYFIGQWRLLTTAMMLTAVRSDVHVLRARCAYLWLPIPIHLLRAAKQRLSDSLNRLARTRSRRALAIWSWRRRFARAISRLGPRFGWLETMIRGEPSVAGWGLDRVFRRMIRDALRQDESSYNPIPRRIVLVCGSLQPGGAERQVAYTVAGLRSKPIESLHLLCDHLSPNNAAKYDFYLPMVVAAGARVRQIRTRISPGERRRLPSRLAEVAAALPSGLVADIANLYWEFSHLRPEIVHAWLDWSNIRAGLAAVLALVPKVVISGRNLNPSHFALYANYMDPAYKALVRCPNVVFLNNSEAGARDYAQWLGIGPGDIGVIRNGVDYGARGRLSQPEISRLRRSYGVAESAFLVGGVFRFAAEKRPLLWIDAAALIAKRVAKAHFVLFGQGDMQSEMLTRIAKHGLTARFTLPGVTGDALGAVSMMDVLLLTSFGEGIPNVVLEAQWVGTPVVATNAGGTREAVEDGVTGWIVDEPSAEPLANRVCALFSNGALSDTARARGPDFVRAQFGVARMIAETWNSYGYQREPTILAASSQKATKGALAALRNSEAVSVLGEDQV